MWTALAEVGVCIIRGGFCASEAWVHLSVKGMEGDMWRRLWVKLYVPLLHNSQLKQLAHP